MQWFEFSIWDKIFATILIFFLLQSNPMMALYIIVHYLMESSMQQILCDTTPCINSQFKHSFDNFHTKDISNIKIRYLNLQQLKNASKSLCDIKLLPQHSTIYFSYSRFLLQWSFVHYFIGFLLCIFRVQT